MMKSYSVPFLFAVVLLVGCSSSRPTATSTSDSTQGDTTQATTDERTAQSETTQSESDSNAETSGPERTTAPEDWYHHDPETRNIPGLATETAYETVLKGRAPRDTVVVAIIDSGIDIDHEDLTGTTWTNADEIPGNNTDDDGNGYVDDVQGWNFIGGPDGENVNYDTYELTRLYVDLRKRFGDVDSAEVSPSERDDYRRFQKIKRTFRKKHKQAQKEYKNVKKARDAVQSATEVLKDHLGTDTLTRDTVESVVAVKREVQRARDVVLYFYEQDLSPEDILEYYDHVKRRAKYNYNPDFNPRSIVGDDYSDKTERYYGNNNVTGPDAHHGTHVAGIIGATRNNGVGTDGVARGVRLMPVRTVPNGDERDKDVANAIRYAVANGADIINMSFGKGYSPHKEVVDAAVQHADSMGVLMVHAAGNDGSDADTTDNFPTRRYSGGGRAERWIEVGASSWRADSSLAAPFSNYGDETVDVFAPGESIYSTTPNNKYDRSNGTSMAAPMVSGLSALLMAYYPSLTSRQVRNIILKTAVSYKDVQVVRPGKSDKMVPFGELSRTGSIVNAPAALNRAEQVTKQGDGP